MKGADQLRCLRRIGVCWRRGAAAQRRMPARCPAICCSATTELPRVAAAVAKNSSSTSSWSAPVPRRSPGPDGASAYPARLEARSASGCPASTVKVTTDLQPRQTAAEIGQDMEKLLLEQKPDLVIWQTGPSTRSRIDPDEFEPALEYGGREAAGGGPTSS